MQLVQNEADSHCKIDNGISKIMCENKNVRKFKLYMWPAFATHIIFLLDSTGRQWGGWFGKAKKTGRNPRQGMMKVRPKPVMLGIDRRGWVKRLLK